MKFRLVEDKKEYSPRDVKRDTCYAVAYSICKGISYKEALRTIPDGKLSTMREILVDKEGIPINYFNEEITANQFSKKYNKGTYLIVVDGHAMACVDGTIYDTQGKENKGVVAVFTFNENRTNKETSFVDAVNNQDNYFIDYAVDYLLSVYPNASSISYITRGTSGFDILVDNDKIEFDFPFLVSKNEVEQTIKDTIDRFSKR